MDFEKSKLEKVERIWAKNGMVYILLKNGQTRRKTVSKAAQEAYVINQMLKQARQFQPHLVKHHEELLEKLMAALKEAKHQLEEKEDGAMTLKNFIEGKTEDGVPIVEVSEDDNIQHLTAKYPLVDDLEVAAALRQAQSYADAEFLIARMNHMRAQE
jgi:pyruvate dehydrogenase complex dehydrogenase (E1) component